MLFTSLPLVGLYREKPRCPNGLECVDLGLPSLSPYI